MTRKWDALVARGGHAEPKCVLDVDGRREGAIEYIESLPYPCAERYTYLILRAQTLSATT